MSIQSNIDEIRKRMADACQRSGRSIDSVQLIAVTKTLEPDTMLKAIEYGARVVGENKVQEILRKFDAIPSDVQWHLIGHLQTNKVRQILDYVVLIHSVDSVSLATEIQKRAEKSSRIVDILIEVNVAQEESKHGLKLGDVEPLLREIESMKNIRVCGLMTVAPFTDDPEDVRIYFKELKQLFDHLKGVKLENVKMEILSMGMTNDYEVAIEEGATLIRVGTGIFGERDYHL